MKTFHRLSLSLLTLLLTSPLLWAQNSYEVSFMDYTVHYNTFPSKFLEPHVSKAVGIKRSLSHGVITIAVKKRTDNGHAKAVSAEIHGTASNLIGQIRPLHLIEFKDGDALYYVGDFPVARTEKLTFKISVRPDGETKQEEFKFSRQF